MKRSLLLLLLLASFPCVAQSGVDQDLQSAVTAANQAWGDGMRRGDAGVIAATYAMDAVHCSAEGQCVSGVRAIQQQLASRMASQGRARTATLSTTSLVRDRDLAYEWGYSETSFAAGRPVRARYLTVWQSQAGGWKILRTMALPTGGAGRRPGRDMSTGRGPEQTFTVRCESSDMGRHDCTVPYQVNRVEVLRQISGSPCVKDRSWGWRSNAIWVDRGCRAEFTVYGYATDAAPEAAVDEPAAEYNDPRTIKSVRCESEDMGYRLCAAGGAVRSARMVRQLSGSACTEAKTWGWKSDGVWVDKGCRAEFEVVLR